VKAPKCATLRYLLQTLEDDDDSHSTIRLAVRSPGQEIAEDDGVDGEMLENTDVPASSAMHLEPPEVQTAAITFNAKKPLVQILLWRG